MIQNLFTAGAKGGLKGSGIDLEYVETISDNSTYAVLRKVEERYPFVATSLIPVFYPGGLRIKEEDRSFWEEAEYRRSVKNLYPNTQRSNAPIPQVQVNASSKFPDQSLLVQEGISTSDSATRPSQRSMSTQTLETPNK